MAIEIIDGMTVDTTILAGREWDGCCWIHPDGKVVAVNYAHHCEYASELLGRGSSYALAHSVDHPGMLHVSEWTWATRKPTAAQKDILAHLATKYEKVKFSMNQQGWHVENYDDRSEKWAV
jgi:hypothetical protein